ncbi:hypothetical protein N9164_15830, partial [Draconibacterium sp.]|nr:hypothetical protein [Draconibacterium sp.]
MNKLLIFLMLFIFNCYNLQAQDGFVKYSNDAEYRDSIIVYKGEMLPFTITQNPDIINVIIDRDTITSLKKKSDKFEVVSSVTNAYGPRKDEFLQLRNNGKVWLNAIGIPKNESIILISEKGSKLIELTDNREAFVERDSLGKTCRLIISNSPTIFYSTNELTRYVEPELPAQDSTQPGPDASAAQTLKNWPWWYYLIMAVALIGVGFVIWIILKKKRKLNSNEVVFKAKSLTEFANNYGGLNTLNKLNPEMIPSKRDWEKNSDKEKMSKIKKLKGKRIIIKPESENLFGFQEGNNNQSNDEQINESESET